MTPCFIIARDRFTMIKNTVEQCYRLGCVPVIVDNASTYGPLLDWYSGAGPQPAPSNVIRLNEWQQGKFPHRNVWNHVLTTIEEFQHIWKSDYYVVTDPDLNLSCLPTDTLEKLKFGLTKGLVHKCGVSLSLEGIHPEWIDKVLVWEKQFWENPKYILGQKYYEAPIDTTFALYNIYNAFEQGCWDCCAKSLRIGKPYTVQHVPWHVGQADWTPEDKYYFEHMNRSISWTFSKEEEYNGTAEHPGAVFDPSTDVSESST